MTEQADTMTISVRGVRRSLAAGMDLCAASGGQSREKMLQELFEQRFGVYEQAIEEARKQVKVK